MTPHTSFFTIDTRTWPLKPVPDRPELRQIICREKLEEQIKAVGRQLNHDYAGQELTTMPILEGGSYIHGQTTWKLPATSRHRTVSIVASRYGEGTTGGEIKLYLQWISENAHVRSAITGKHVLIFDDVLDKGDTILAVIDALQAFQPASIKTLFMARKDVPRPREVQADYVLFEVADLWLVGAGLDDDGRDRHLPYIACKQGVAS